MRDSVTSGGHTLTQLQREHHNWYQCPCCHRGSSSPGTCDGVLVRVGQQVHSLVPQSVNTIGTPKVQELLREPSMVYRVDTSKFEFELAKTKGLVMDVLIAQSCFVGTTCQTE